MRARGSIQAAFAVLAAALAIGCGGSDDSTTDTTTAAGGPPEQAGGDGGGPPDTGDGGEVALEQIGEFDEPVYLTQARGDDDLYVVERCGRIVRVPAGEGEPETFADLTGEVGCGGSEQGLLSVAFPPDHRRSGLLYVYLTDQAGTVRVLELARDGDDPGTVDPQSARELLAIEEFAPNHNGGQLQFGPDGLLYLGTGDGGGSGDPERTAQDLDSLLGKLLRIDPRPRGGRPYGIPASNPHADDSGARPEILAHGLRNPWRFSFDRETGDLWIGDVGQSELEEIDSVRAGHLPADLDFGWSAFEATQRFNEDQEAPDAIEPTLEYGRAGGECSVTGGYVVRDPAVESLYGRYVYGDFCTGELRSFTADAGGGADDDRSAGATVPALSSFGEDADGGVYALSLEGPVFRLSPAER